jgi:ClpP class serine protease
VKIYAAEPGFIARLLSDRRELLAYARSLGSASAMREARADLLASTPINVAPTSVNPLRLDVRGGVAHIPIVGELTPHAETDACGAFTAQALTEYGFILAALAEAEGSPDVSAIALDINSPGGYVDGVDEVAQAIASASKPVTAYVGGMAASAAYWLATQADRLVALSPASRVGSIGVAAEEYNSDAALAAEGIAHRVYTSTDAPDKRPDTSTPEGRAKIVAELDSLHAVFVRRVAEGRHVTPAHVSGHFGRGGLVIAEDALKAGMVDEVLGAHLSRPSAGVASSAAATSAAIPKKEVHMDLNQLLAEHPDLSREIDAREASAFDKGVAAERSRREKLLALSANAEARKAVDAAIASGESFEEASPKIVIAALKGTGGENAPEISTAAAATGSGAGDVDFAALARKAGLTSEAVSTYGPKDKE